LPASGDSVAGFGYRAHTDTVALAPDVRADLEWVRDDFDHLVSNVATGDLDAPTNGTKWTNRGLLFHLWFGQRIARSFIPLIGGFSRLPPGASRAWARLLAGVTKPYEWVNYIASAAGGRLVPIQVTRAWMRRDTDALIRWAEQASPADLARGMSVPPRYVKLLHLPVQDSITVHAALVRTLGQLPAGLRRTLTWDQGTEMARHLDVAADAGIKVYFCDAASPWQRGSNENTNGLLRQYFPKSTDLSLHTPADLARVELELNRRPRMVLGDRTPAELFNALLTSQNHPPLR
jgi:hypothetical protein